MAGFDDFFIPDPESKKDAGFDALFVEEAPRPEPETGAERGLTTGRKLENTHAESAAQGFAQGGSLGWFDEGVALGDAMRDFAARKGIIPESWRPERTHAQKMVDEDFGEADFWTAYDRSLRKERARRDQASSDNPGSYAGGELAGAAATSLAAPSGLVGGAAVGALGGAGYADEDKLGGAEMGLMLGGGLGAAASKAPVLTSLGAGALGVGAATFGEDLGLTPEQRWQAGLGGGAALVGAGAAAASKVSNNASKFLKGRAQRALARAQEERLPAVKSAEGALESAQAAERAAQQRAADMRATAGEKSAALESRLKTKLSTAEDDLRAAQQRQVLDFADRSLEGNKKYVDDLNAQFRKRFAEEEASRFKTFDDSIDDLGKRRIAGQKEAEAGLVEAFVKEEARKVNNAAASAAAEGADPRTRAVSALGHRAKELYGMVRTQLGLGKPLPPEVEHALTVLHPDFEAGMKDASKAFAEGKPALLDKLIAQFEAETAERAAKLPMEATGTDNTLPSYMRNVEREGVAPPPKPSEFVSEDTKFRLAQEAGVASPPEEVTGRMRLEPRSQKDVSNAIDTGRRLRAAHMAESMGLNPEEKLLDPDNLESLILDKRFGHQLPRQTPNPALEAAVGKAEGKVGRAKKLLSEYDLSKAADPEGLTPGQRRAMDRALEKIEALGGETAKRRGELDAASTAMQPESIYAEGLKKQQQAADSWIPTGPVNFATGATRNAMGLPQASVMGDSAVQARLFSRLAEKFETDQALVSKLPALYAAFGAGGADDIVKALQSLAKEDPAAASALDEVLSGE